MYTSLWKWAVLFKQLEDSIGKSFGNAFLSIDTSTMPSLSHSNQPWFKILTHSPQLYIGWTFLHHFFFISWKIDLLLPCCLQLSEGRESVAASQTVGKIYSYRNLKACAMQCIKFGNLLSLIDLFALQVSFPLYPFKSHLRLLSSSRTLTASASSKYL